MKIGNRNLEKGGHVYIIAEAGSNHNNDLEIAMGLIDVAADSKADAVKFQLFKAKTLYHPNAGKSNYLGLDVPIYDIIKNMELDENWLPILSEYAKSKGLDFLVTPFDLHSVITIEPHVPAIKIASYDFTNFVLIEKIMQTGLPIIISTGTANDEEISKTVSFLKEGQAKFVILQCTASYPAKIEDSNLKSISAMSNRYGILSGLSDHSTDPIIAPVVAVAEGAVIIEKHFTLDKSSAGPDHAFSLNPEELKIMVTAIRQATTALGDGKKVLKEAETELRSFARRWIYSNKDLNVGEVIDEDKLILLRNGEMESGEQPELYWKMLGKTTAKIYKKYDPIFLNELNG